MSSVIEDSLEHLVKGIVEHPEDVSVRARSVGAAPETGAAPPPTRSGCTPMTSAG